MGRGEDRHGSAPGVMGPTRCGSALADLDLTNGPRVAWSSPGAPHRGGGLLASEPGLVTGTHDLRRTIERRVVPCPPLGTRVSRSETAAGGAAPLPRRPACAIRPGARVTREFSGALAYGASMASRPSSSQRSSTAAATRAKGGWSGASPRPPAARSTRPAQRKPATRKPAPKTPSKAKGGGLPFPLGAVRNTWMGVSHLAGGAVRRVGHSAADLEPEHRRDGIGFTLIALAVVVAAREWWGVSGTFGQVVHAVFAGTFGRVAYAVPLVLLALGLRMLRAPQDEAATNRIVVGTIALTFAACGLSHLADGIPNPPDGADGMRAAGGIIGFLASSPLAAAVSTYGALVLLILLGLFGLLVITATPVSMIPTRMRQLRALVTPHDHDDDDFDDSDDPDDAPAAAVKRARRKPVDLAHRDGDEAFRQAAQ